MPTELEELVEFLHHGNTQIRQIATENLVPFSVAQPAIFQGNGFEPIKDLKLLVKDYTPIAKNALTILINLSSDPKILAKLAEDTAFLESLLIKVTNAQEPNGNDFATLLANLGKSPSIERLTTMERTSVKSLSTSPRAIFQLMELYNAGAMGKYNKHADYDYLAYLFADLAKYDTFQKLLTTPTPHSPLDPLTLFLPLTTHTSPIRRLGTATLLRNLALVHPDPLYLLQPASSVLPAILLPLCGTDQSNITAEEMDLLPEECQYLIGPDNGGEGHVPESDPAVLILLLEALYLLIARSGRDGRRVAREHGAYVVIRELHLRLEESESDQKVRKECEKIVDVLMMDNEDGPGGEGKTETSGIGGGGSKPAAALIEDDSHEAKGSVKGLSDKDGGVESGKVVELPDEDENEITPIF